MAVWMVLIVALSVYHGTNFKQVLALCNLPSSVQYGKVLTNSVFKYASHSDMLSCAALCLRHALCQSFDLNLIDQSCYLNFNSSTDESNLELNVEYVHSDIDGWSRDLAGQCKNVTCNLWSYCEVDRFGRASCKNIKFHNAEYDVKTEYSQGLPLNWTMARSACEQLGGHLAMLDDAQENLFVSTIMQEVGFANKVIWIGASTEGVEGSWFWVDGRPLDYDGWSMEQPETSDIDDCVAIKPNNGWWSNPCSNERNYICEVTA